MLTIADTIIAEARAKIGLPFRHHGRGPFAYDCLGLVLHACHCAGVIPLEVDDTSYSLNVADYELEQRLNAAPYFERLPHWREAQPADILLQRFHASLPASHLRLITRREGAALWSVHAGRNGVVEQRVMHLERNRAAYRIKEVTNG